MSDAADTKTETVGIPLIGALRLVRLSVPSGMSSDQNAIKSIETFTRHFLENTIREPFQYKVIRPTCFSLHAECSDEEMEDFVLSLHMRLKEFLFGSETDGQFEILSIAGSPTLIDDFMEQPLPEARDMSAKFQRLTRQRQKEATDKPSNWDFSWTGGSDHIDQQFRFRAILETRHRVLIGQSLTVRDKHDVQDSRDVHTGNFLQARAGDTIDFEIAALQHAARQIKTGLDAGKSILLFTPVSYTTLVSNDLHKQFQAAAEVLPEKILNHIGLVFFNAPSAPSFNAVQRCNSGFPRLFRFIDWQIITSEFRPELFTGSQIHTVTLDLDSFATDRIGELNRFAKNQSELKKLKIRACATGLKDRDEVLTALKAGLSFLSGPAISVALKNPYPARQISPSQLPMKDDLRTDLNSVRDAIRALSDQGNAA